MTLTLTLYICAGSIARFVVLATRSASRQTTDLVDPIPDIRRVMSAWSGWPPFQLAIGPNRAGGDVRQNATAGRDVVVYGHCVQGRPARMGQQVATSSIGRRDFIALVVGGATLQAILPLAARAQQPAMPLIGFLNSASPDQYTDRVRAFHEGLGQIGYAEGRNVAVEYRWANGQYNRLPELAADLVRRQVAVIASTGGTPAALAAKAATSTIPIVFQVAADPVKIGLVASLNRPGGNVTGVTNLNLEVGPKRLELMHELVPAATIVALLVNPANPEIAGALSKDTMVAARALGLQLHVLNASTERDFDAAFATAVQLRSGGLIIAPDSSFNSLTDQLAALTIRHALPAIWTREFALAGGLMGYSGNLADVYRRVGEYTGRILKGEKPSNLPVQQASRVELIINLKTAKVFGLTVPQSLLARADEVIE